MNCPGCGAEVAAGLQFCQACGRPMAGSTTGAAPAASPSPTPPPVAAQPASYAPPAPAKSGGSALPWILGGCGCLLVLVLLGLAVVGGLAYLGKAQEQATVTTDGSQSSSSSSSSGQVPAVEATPVRVELTWNEEVDMDLEIWDESGENLLDRSFNLCGEDIKVGSGGREWFEFKKFSDEDDYASGTYIVSLYFANRPEGSTVDRASATLTVTKPDGTTVTRTKIIDWEPGRDQWHAFSLNARTGAIVDKDRFIRVQQNNE